MRQRTLVLPRFTHFLRWVRTIGVQTKSQQQQTTYYLQIETICVVAHKIYHETHTKTRDARIDNITQSSTTTSDKTIPSAFVQGALYTKHANRSHRCRSNNTNE